MHVGMPARVHFVHLSCAQVLRIRTFVRLTVSDKCFCIVGFPSGSKCNPFLACHCPSTKIWTGGSTRMSADHRFRPLWSLQGLLHLPGLMREALSCPSSILRWCRCKVLVCANGLHVHLLQFPLLGTKRAQRLLFRPFHFPLFLRLNPVPSIPSSHVSAPHWTHTPFLVLGHTTLDRGEVWDAPGIPSSHNHNRGSGFPTLVEAPSSPPRASRCVGGVASIQDGVDGVGNGPVRSPVAGGDPPRGARQRLDGGCMGQAVGSLGRKAMVDGQGMR